MKRFSKGFFGVVTLSLLASGMAHGAAFDELTPSEQATVEGGGVAFRSVPDDSSSLPKMYLYQLIDATPEECLAVYSDFPLQKSYVPDMLMSDVESRPAANVAIVNFELKTPFPIPNEHYTARVTATQYDGGSSYRSDWKLLHADTTKDTVGSARFEAHGSKTFLAYYNFVTPGTRFASLITGRAAAQVKSTMAAFAGQVTDEKANNPDLLQKQIGELEDSLK